MTVMDAPCNIAQYDLKKNEWSLTERIQLSLYNSYSGGEVYSLLANHTPVYTASSSTTTASASNAYSESVGGASSSSSSSAATAAAAAAAVAAANSNVRYTGSGELLVVGAFDTTYRNSQVTYCSVGMWDGTQLSKVGEGLCNSALSKGMKITTAALAGPQDVYVAGSFQTQVWNGDRHEFVKIFNIAHFNAVEQVWLPLNVGQITCSWCTVTVLALAWDSKRRQLHVAGKFNAIDGSNVPAGLAIYDYDSGHLVAHPGGGLSMRNSTQDGVGTALQLDEEAGVLYVMGSFERLTATYEICLGLAAYEIETDRWTCLADKEHTVLPTGGGNMLLTPFGLMVAGKTDPTTTWPDMERPYTIALLKATLKTTTTTTTKKQDGDGGVEEEEEEERYHDFNWSWLPGFKGSEEPLHALSNGFGTYQGFVFIAGDNLIAKWGYQPRVEDDHYLDRNLIGPVLDAKPVHPPELVPTTEDLSGGKVRGAIMAISQMMPEPEFAASDGAPGSVNIRIIIYCVAIGCVIGVIGAILFNKNISSALFPFLRQEKEFHGFSLDTLTYSAVENSSITEAYHRAMRMRFVHHPHLLTMIDPQQIFLQRIIGEGTFGRVWSAKWRSSSVAVKEFVFAQAAVAGRSSMTQEIIEEIIGEAGMMAILRHPNVLQLFGCSLTAQAIWIVSELCSLGSLRQLLDDNDRVLPLETRLSLALQVAEGMTYLHNQHPPIIHRDLKSHNIFVHETFTDSEDASTVSSKQLRRRPDEPYEKMETQSTIVAKIGDWGSARATMSGSRTMTHGVGTACWLAPEVIKHARSSKFSDVYGYGIVLWELATREEVYQGLETTQIIAKVANENLRPPVPQDCPWKDIMVKCWAENPLDRLEFSEIVQELDALVKHQNGADFVGAKESYLDAAG
jgi:Protein tyrosine and serine/threonine kinase